MADTVRTALDAGVRDFTINSSDGGYVMFAYLIGGRLKREGASLTINGRCLSACALLAFGVPDRRIAPGADVEIHGAWDQRNPADPTPARAAAAYMLANGVPPDLAEGRGTGINAHRLSPLELSRSGFVATP
jgi:hypothetical protein